MNTKVQIRKWFSADIEGMGHIEKDSTENMIEEAYVLRLIISRKLIFFLFFMV